ncbi:BTB/POZ domain-containing protein [Ditylenchus destructor]|nr:BTB/POZ domain-containing protein [Ditylenchus destructor]
MSESNFGKINNWVRLNVGGKVFQTTKDTLTRHPDTLLARLVNAELSSDKVSYLVDCSNQLLCEADFYGLQALIDEINEPVRSNHIETITLCTNHGVDKPDVIKDFGTICFSEPQEDYQVLQALRDRTQLQFKLVSKRRHDIDVLTPEDSVEIQTILRGFGFVQKSYETDYDGFPQCWKFVLQPAANRTEAITICVKDTPYTYYSCQSTLIFSEPQDDYEVLRALRDVPQFNLVLENKGRYSFTYATNRAEFETVLCGFGFVQESYDESEHGYSYGRKRLRCWKYVRTVSK